jgi:hypothetical protein
MISDDTIDEQLCIVKGRKHNALGEEVTRALPCSTP